jgi:acetyltransferase-like isoleucine patch superfamily enzyme
MNRDEVLKDSESGSLYEGLTLLHQKLDNAFIQQFQRSLPFTDELTDRWERAKKLGFGEQSSVYDSSYIFGTVKVGKKVWIGPFTIIDGSGELEIGDHCTISAGAQIYTHDNVAQTLTAGVAPIERAPVRIGMCSYVGPGAVVRKGLTIGSFCIIGAGTFVTHDVPDHAVVVGLPGKIVGTTKIEGGKLQVTYFKS